MSLKSIFINDSSRDNNNNLPHHRKLFDSVKKIQTFLTFLTYDAEIKSSTYVWFIIYFIHRMLLSEATSVSCLRFLKIKTSTTSSHDLTTSKSGSHVVIY